MGEIDFENVGFGTLAIHAGQEPDKLYGALATPIYQTSTFCFDTVEEGTAKFGGQIPGFCYSRGGNPTTVTLEKKIAMLEGGEACISTASGMGAVGGVMLGLLQAGDHGKKAYVIGGNTAIAVTEKRLCSSFEKYGLAYCMERFSGYPSVQKIEGLKAVVKEKDCDVLVGVGGGRIMDLAKAAALELGIPIVAIPTQAATCAAYSPISVLYTPEGKSDDYIHLDYEINAVIVDEQVMLTQPPRLLAAGILDAMAKYIEIATLHPQVLDENTTIARHSAFYMAKYTYDILKMKGEKAIYDLKKGQWTKALHDVIYVNIALTGIVSALMQGKGQTALGHAFNNALHRDFLEYIKKWLHGEGVALGLLV